MWRLWRNVMMTTAKTTVFSLHRLTPIPERVVTSSSQAGERTTTWITATAATVTMATSTTFSL